MRSFKNIALLVSLLFSLAFAQLPIQASAQVFSQSQIMQGPYWGVVMGDGTITHKATASSSPTLNYVTATSTRHASTFPFASTTETSADKFCINSDSCISSWPTGSGGSGFSTTSSDFWLTQRQGAAFSTTSADWWVSTKNFITGIAWGAITGTLSNQADLNAKFATKLGTSSALTANQVIYATSFNTTASVATGTVSCLGVLGCTSFTVLGGSASISLSGTKTANQMLYFDTGASNIRSVATSSPIFSYPFTTSGTAGYLVDGSGFTIAFSGVSTSAAPTIGNLAYWTSDKLLGTVATTSVICSGTVSCSGFNVLGNSPITITGSAGTSASSTALSDNNTFSGLDTFTKLLTLGAASTTFLTATNFWEPGQSSGCAQFDSNAKLTSTGVNCGSGSSGGDPFTHVSVFGQTSSATSTLVSFTGSPFSLVASSTSWFDQINVGSTTVGGMSTSTFYGNVEIKGKLQDDSITSALILDNASGLAGAYGGTSCTNQFIRSLNGAGAATCNSVADADFTGQLGAAHGGTGKDFSASTGVIVDYNGTFAATASSTLFGSGTGGQFLAWLNGVPTWTASTTYTGTSPMSLTFASGQVTAAIANAAADGSTKGAASFNSSDFDAASGNISLDYTNGQAASASNKGFLTSADWNKFNNQLSTTSPWTTGQIAFVNANGNVSSVATGTVSAGSSAITVTAGRSAIGGALAIDCAGASSSQNGCLSSTDWSTFNGKLNLSNLFNQDTNFGAATLSTTTAFWFKSGMQASSTSQFANASSTLATIGSLWGNSIFGFNLSSCTGSNFLQWSAGTFGCAAAGAGSQTPWTQNIEGGGFNLNDAGTVTANVFAATSTTATSTFRNAVEIGTTTATGDFVSIQNTSIVDGSENALQFYDSRGDKMVAFDSSGNVVFNNIDGANFSNGILLNAPTSTNTSGNQLDFYGAIGNGTGNGGLVSIQARQAGTSGNGHGGNLDLRAGTGHGTGVGGVTVASGGGGGSTGPGGAAQLIGGDSGSNGGDGGEADIFGGSVKNTGTGGMVDIIGGLSLSTGANAGPVFILGGFGGLGSVGANGGSVYISGGRGSDDGVDPENAGNLVLMATSSVHGGTNGVVEVQNTSGINGVLDMSSLAASDKTFTFPNSSGTLCLTTTCTGSGGAWPFIGDSYNGSLAQSTTTPIWLKNTLVIASSTFFTQASTTQFTNSGATFLGGNITFPATAATTTYTIGVQQQTLAGHAGEGLTISSGNANASGNNNGGNIQINSGTGRGTGNGGNFTFQGGSASATGGTGGSFAINGGVANGGSASGGTVAISGGAGRSSGSGGAITIRAGGTLTQNLGTNGPVYIFGGDGVTSGTGQAGANVVISGGSGSDDGASGASSGGNIILVATTSVNGGTNGKVEVQNSTGINGVLDMGSLAVSDKTFTFPNTTGTLCLTTTCATALGYTPWGGSLATTFGTTTVASTTPAWFQTGMYASSTSQFANASTTLLTTGTFWNTSITSALPLFDSNHKETAYVGSAPCSNQVALSLSAAGVLTCTSITDAMFSGQLGIAHGGTATSTWQANSVPFYSGSFFTEDNGNFAYSSGKLTLTSASTTNLSVSNFFTVPNSASQTVSKAGQIAEDTTSGQLLWSDGTNTHVNNGHFYFSTFASSTAAAAWVGTTTIFVENVMPSGGETYNAVRCSTDAGTLNVDVYQGSTHLNFFNASTTNNKFTFTSNNSLSAGNLVKMDIGTPATSPRKLGCTFDVTLNAD